MSDWVLEWSTYRPDEEGHREALCTLGNGFFATRGAAPETYADEVHYPGTYLAGLYDRARTEIAGRTVENEDLVNVPNWLPFTFRAEDGDWFHIDEVEIVRFHQVLDLMTGVLSREIRFKEGGRTTNVLQRRFVHMGHRHIAALETVVEPVDWAGRIEFRSAIDASVENMGVERYRSLETKHHDIVESGSEDGIIFTVVETRQSHVRVAVAASTRVYGSEGEVDVEKRTVSGRGHVAQEFEVDSGPGRPVHVEKIVGLFTSRDRAASESRVEAVQRVRRARRFRHLIRFHSLSWGQLWRRFRVAMDPAGDEQRILNLHIFHLLQTISLQSIDLDIGVPARGWHGEAYRGHVFWDELFIFPFLNLRLPELTRALLLYRYRRLPEARYAAWKMGHLGAMFPWQSGSNGREETQVLHLNPRSGKWIPDESHRQHHVNIAIAYNVWQYYEVTQDREFMASYGAEMILEIARFWASLASFDDGLDRYVIKGVMGPDEYHESYPDADIGGLDNNAYTNVMVAWVFDRALQVLEVLPKSECRELRERLELTDVDLQLWEDMSRRMFVPFHGDGIISQFEGYEKLEEFDWVGYKGRYGNIQRLDRILGAEGDTADRYKASKQADVLMLFYVLHPCELQGLMERLGHSFDRDAMERTIEYYISRTSHGSTLSGVVHSWVLSRMDREASWEFFTGALISDVADVQGGTTKEGIHLGAMAGTVDLIQRCYAGISTHDDVLWVNPSLPEELERISLDVRYRAQWVSLEADCDKLIIKTDRGENTDSIHIGVGDTVLEIGPGETQKIELGGCG